MGLRAARFAPQLSPKGVLLAIVCSAWIVGAMDWIPAALEDDDGSPAWFARNEIAIPAASQPVPAPRTSGDRVACDGCETVESVRAAEKRQNSGMGGEVMAVLQVVLNAMVGNSKSSPAVQSRKTAVCFHDRVKRAIAETGQPAWKLVDPVWVMNGRINPDA